MRRLLLVRGPQGAGKSTFLRRDLAMDGHIISPDDARLLLGGAVLDNDGVLSVPQQRSKEAWELCLSSLERRMQAGETLAFDATHPLNSDMQIYAELARKWRYEVACVDFFNMDPQQALKQNAERHPPRRVPQDVVLNTIRKAQPLSPRLGFRHIPWRADGQHVKDAKEFIDSVNFMDLSAYRAVVHIGDLQGCKTVIDQPNSPLAGGLKKDEFYIFIGDLLDRGIENGKVIRWWLDHVAGRNNVVLLWGNHEDHLHRWSRGLPVMSREFLENTQPQLEKEGIQQSDIDGILAEAKDALVYQWRDRRVVCSHAGLPNLPSRLGLVSLEQLCKGVGGYNHPVDEAFSQKAPAGWVQVHGHRNPRRLPIFASQRSFNLEGGVEFGGHLRALILDDQGWHPREIPNPVFRKQEENHMQNNISSNNKQLPENSNSLPMPLWAESSPPQNEKIQEQFLTSMQSHPFVYERRSKTFPHISSLNFTRQTFKSAAWDDITIRARGLFLDGERRIVARAYEKFFNFGERPETNPDAITKLNFPVRAYLKENGFLGILGYDANSKQLLFCSKSSTEGPFAGMFQDIFRSLVPMEQAEKIRQYLHDTNSSMVFEVIDPQKDPHIISYERAQIILLDVVRRSIVFERLPYDQLKILGSKIGIPVKEEAMVFHEPAPLLKTLTDMQNDRNWRWQGREIEGFVLEDASGFQFKAKTAYYSFWKKMRSHKTIILHAMGKNKEIKFDQINDPEEKAFISWALQQTTSTLKKDIISLRQEFYSEGQNKTPPERPVERIDPALRGFSLAISSVEEVLNKGGEINPMTAWKLVKSAQEDERKAKILSASSQANKIRFLAIIYEETHGQKEKRQK